NERKGLSFFTVRKTCSAIAKRMIRNVMAVNRLMNLSANIIDQCSNIVDGDAYLVAGPQGKVMTGYDSCTCHDQTAIREAALPVHERSQLTRCAFHLVCAHSAGKNVLSFTKY